MSYVEKTLGPSEKIIYRARFPWIYFARAWAALLVLGIVIIGIVIFVDLMVRAWTTEIAVTNYRIVKKTGLISRKTEEIALKNIEEVRLDQSFWGRILGYGYVIIEGTGTDAMHFPALADPLGFRRAVEAAIEGVK